MTRIQSYDHNIDDINKGNKGLANECPQGTYLQTLIALLLRAFIWFPRQQESYFEYSKFALLKLKPAHSLCALLQLSR